MGLLPEPRTRRNEETPEERATRIRRIDATIMRRFPDDAEDIIQAFHRMERTRHLTGSFYDIVRVDDRGTIWRNDDRLLSAEGDPIRGFIIDAQGGIGGIRTSPSLGLTPYHLLQEQPREVDASFSPDQLGDLPRVPDVRTTVNDDRDLGLTNI